MYVVLSSGDSSLASYMTSTKDSFSGMDPIFLSLVYVNS